MDKQVVITRELNAPRELVFKAWTDPKMLKQWWGPEHFTSPEAHLDPRVGGRLLLAMQAPDGAVFWSGGEIKEYDPPYRLAWTDYFADEHGNMVSPAAYGLPADFPEESLITVTFEALDGNRTKITLYSDTSVAEAESVGAIEGWNSSLNKLAAVVEAAAAATV